MDYRERCYRSFVSKHWQFSHSLSSRQYEHLWRIYKKRYNKFLPSDKSSRIIDVACGTGYFVYFLQKEGYKAAKGIDLSNDQLKIAKKMGVKNLKQADLFKYLPSHRQNFDVIVANDIIEHLRKIEVLDFLDMVYRSLVSSGKVLISTVNVQSLFGATVFWNDFTHETGFTPNSLSQVMRVCNFKDVEVYGEKPIVYDFRSAIRAGFWWCNMKMLKAYVTVERGTGRGLWRNNDIFEPRILAVGMKSDA